MSSSSSSSSSSSKARMGEGDSSSNNNNNNNKRASIPTTTTNSDDKKQKIVSTSATATSIFSSTATTATASAIVTAKATATDNIDGLKYENTRLQELVATLEKSLATKEGELATKEAECQCLRDENKLLKGRASSAPSSANTTPLHHKIDFAFKLNFERRPRMDRYGDEEIKVHKRKQAQEIEKAYALLTAKRLGWQDNSLHSKGRMKIARAVCRQVAFDNGYEKPFSASRLRFWDEKLTEAIDDGTSPDPLSSNHRGSVGYCKGIEDEHPGYIREMFRYAQRTLGSKASYKALAETMNWKSDVPGEIRPSLSLHHEQVRLWFISEGGKEFSPIEKI